MIVDSSVIVSIIRKEPGADAFAALIDRAETPRLSAAGYLEIAIVVDSRRNPKVSRELDEFLRSSGIGIEPVTERQARIAREAYRDYGKGSGHAAGLNFGDCFAYALARDMNEPLLFKGDDFRHTDVKPAIA
ncbi:MAG: type II toxin-antitoxin system VapC family toxin [Bauldia sp.]|nr:type II toxin-antitoxin system VapC family toxin [Bauldia sp.]